MPKTAKSKIKKTTKKSTEKKPKKAPVKRKAGKAETRTKKVGTAAKKKPASPKKSRRENIGQILPVGANEIDIEGAARKERDKRMLLWTGVGFFMLLILAFWLIGLKQTFKRIESENANKSGGELDEITEDLGKAISEMKKN